MVTEYRMCGEKFCSAKQQRHCHHAKLIGRVWGEWRMADQDQDPAGHHSCNQAHISDFRFYRGIAYFLNFLSSA